MTAFFAILLSLLVINIALLALSLNRPKTEQNSKLKA